MELRDQLQEALGREYSIERELGGGGMSRVFLAHETALGRSVVIKVLNPDLAAGVSSERFTREIRLVAQLHHPHIAQVLNSGDAAGLPYYTTPFVEGLSLRGRLSDRGALPVHECVSVLRDVVRALGYAHEHGVIHRDIKPENVLLAGDSALVTDFGIAKAISASRTYAPGATLTSVGTSLGTPAYMSPEQVAGDPADHRADLYAWGVMAYEMLAGRHPFADKSSSQQLMAAHVSETPAPVSTQRADVPVGLAALVMRCLEKDPVRRPQSAREIAHALDAVATPPADAAAGLALRRRSARARWSVPVLVVAAAAIAWFVVWRRAGTTLEVGSATQITNAAGLEIDAAISPDGKLVAYAAGKSGNRRIFVRQIAGGRTVQLADSPAGEQRLAKWSPDGSQLVFQSDGALYVVPSFGGTARRIVERESGPLVTPTWSPDGKRIAYADDRGIWVRPLESGTATLVAKGEALHSPAWSPDGDRLVYVVENSGYLGLTQSIGNIAPSAIWIVAAAGGDPSRLTEMARLSTSPVWTADGHGILFVSNQGSVRDIYLQSLRGDRAVGPPARLTTGLNPFTISLDAGGTQLAYSTLVIRNNIWMAPITESGPTPATALRQITSENQAVEGFALSPDGNSLAFDSNRNGSQHIFVMPAEGGEPVQVTRDSTDEFQPAWSPDGRRLAFHSPRRGSRDIYVVDVDGRNEEQVTSGPEQEFRPAWSPDGQRIAFLTGLFSRARIMIASRGADGRWSAPQFVGSDRVSSNVSWWPSVDLNYANADSSLVVAPAESGAPRVLVQAKQAGYNVVKQIWSRDGTKVLYSAEHPDGAHSFWAIPASGGSPRLLLRLEPQVQVRRYGIDTDGRRLFFTIASDESDVWVMELRRK